MVRCSDGRRVPRGRGHSFSGLVGCSIAGFGSSGPYASMLAFAAWPSADGHVGPMPKDPATGALGGAPLPAVARAPYLGERR